MSEKIAPTRGKRFASYVSHLWETVKETPFTKGWWPYFAITGAGIAAATWLIPYVNESHTGPETLGVYVLGILLTVFADALFVWKKNRDDAVTETVIAVSFVLALIAGKFATKVRSIDEFGVPVHDWHRFSSPLLWVIFFLAVLMWAMLNVVEPKFHNNATGSTATLNNL